MSTPDNVNHPHVGARSVVALRPLFFRAPAHSGEDWVIGHEASDTCIALPEAAILAIRELQRGLSVADTHVAVVQQCGEDLDIADFVTQLWQLGLVSAIDGQSTTEVKAIGQRWLERIHPEWVSWLCARPTLLLLGLLILAGPLVLLFDAGVRPRPTDVLWAPSYTVDFWALAIVGWALVLKHELGHLLVARAKGLVGQLTIGRRLFYLVVVSRIPGIWKLPRRDRLLIYCAGMISDCATAGALALLVAAADMHLLPLAPLLRPLFRLLLIGEYIGIAWQLQIFMKTDVYHIVVDLTDLHDLPERGHAWLMALIRRLISRPRRRQGQNFTGGSSLFPRTATERVIGAFSLVQVFGITCSYSYLVLYLGPAYIAAIRGELSMLTQSLPHGDMLASLDAVVALALQAFTYVFLIRSLAMKYLPRISAWRRARQQNRRLSRLSGTREEGAITEGASL